MLQNTSSCRKSDVYREYYFCFIKSKKDTIKGVKKHALKNIFFITSVQNTKYVHEFTAHKITGQRFPTLDK